MKIERTIGFYKKLDGRYSWDVVLFEKGNHWAFSTVKPGFFDTFATEKECHKNIKETFKKLGMKIDMKKKAVIRI